jgi:hypothetical protein
MTASTAELARYPVAPTVTPRRGKDLDNQAGWVDGYRFAAYGGVTCKMLGLDQENMKAGLQKSFETGESAAVERALMSVSFAANAAGAGIPGSWAAATDITPAAGAVSPVVAISQLEEYAASIYNGAPTLHLPISVASQALVVNGASFDGNRLMTAFGSKVAAGAGYAYPNLSPTGANPAAGEHWAYVSGEVAVIRSDDVIVKDVVDLAHNNVLALVERGYLVAVDCFTAAIKVKING